MFKLSFTSRWTLMAARGWARLILDRRRVLINDRPSRAAAAEVPLDGAQERHHEPDNSSYLLVYLPLTWRILPRRSGIASMLCPVLLLIT